MKMIIFFIVALLSFTNAFSYEGEYRLGLLSNNVFNPTLPTHVVIAGSAVKEDSNQFFQSALARALRIKEVFPNDQIIIMSSPEVVGKNDDEVFADFHVNVIKTVEKSFTQERMIAELSEFKKIKSINFYGHSSPWAFKLGKKDAAFDPSSVAKQLKAIKPNFLPEAYITFNSCNSGFEIAPELSQILEIPVAGTLTSGLFERIESDGKWYKESDYTKENYVTNNQTSFTQDYECTSTGACVRMKPSRYNYSSYWGYFVEGGLSFAKFFCVFNNSNSQCEKAMAMSLVTLPSVKPINLNSKIEDFKEVAFDWLCQTSTNRNLFENCKSGIIAAITRGDLVFKSHTNAELNCDFNSCNAKVVCKDKVFGSGPRKGSCHLETTATESPTNVAREYLAFLKGFELIKK